MGWFSQLGLLLKKNVIQRLRHPVLLIFEVIWPIAIFLAVAIVRQGAGPQQKQECVYNARAMPSAGLVPFIQTFVCNINNQCKNRTDQVVAGATVGARIGKVIDKLEPVLMSKNTKNVLKNLPENVKTIQAINKVLEKKEVQDFIDANMTLGRFFTDPNAVEKFLVSDLRVMKRDVVRSLMAATVNMSKVMELMDTLRFREIVCKPALLASYLVFPEKTNVTLISQELCNINDTLIPSITKTIQMQINIAEIIRLASELSNVFGNYTLTSQLNDVATMVDLLMKYTPLKVVLQQFPELSLLSQWLTNIFAIVTDYKPSEKLDLTLLGNVLDDLDPLIVKWTNNSQEWQDIKKTFYYASQLVTWLTQGIDSLPRMRLTFGMLFPNTTSIKEYITKSSQVTPEVVEALLGATIDRAKLQALIGKAQATNSSLKQLLCDGDHYSQVITLPPTANIVLMKRVQSSLCAFNFSVLSQEINDAFKIDTIVKQLAEFDRSQIGQQSLNWTTVINTGQKLMASVSRLLQSYIGDIGRVLKDLDLRAVWHSLGGLVLPGNNTAEESLKVLQQTLINSLQSLQSVLEQQSDWPVTRRVFIVVDFSLDVLEASTNYASDLHRYFSIFLHNSTILQDMLGALSDMGPRTAASIISALTEPSNVQKILQDPSHLSRIFCDQALVGVFFKLPPGVNTTDVKHHMCNLDLTALTNEIQKLSNMTQLITAVENLMRVSEAGFLDKSELVSRADLKTIAQRTSDVISKLVHVVTSYVDSSKSVVWPEVNIKWNATIWQQVWEDITKQQTNALMSNLITGVGPVLENSTLWTTVGPYVKSLNAVLEHINRQVLSQAPSPILDQLIKYLKDYGIDFIKALTQLVQSPAKTKELFALTRDFKLLCDPVNFQRLFQLPPSVPVSDVLQFACNLNASVIVNEILTVYDTSIVTAEIMRYFNHSLPDGTARDFDWDRLVHTLNQLQFKAPLMLTKNPFSLFATLMSDYTKISSAVDGLFTAMQNMSWNGFESVALFSIEQLGNLDAMLVNDSTWRMVKYGINVVDVIVQGMTKQMKSMSDGTFKLEDMFANATVMKDFLQSTADMAPDMMEVIMKTALDPSKMVITMLKIDWSKKTICNGVSFTDLMDFPDTEAVTEFERQLCKMNADYLSEQLQNSPMQKPMTEAIEVFFKPWDETNPMPDIQLDWKAIDQNMREMFEVMMKPMNATGMMNNLPQVNLTAFEVKMNSSVDLFLNYDWSGVNVAGFQDLYNLVDNMTLNGSDDVWKLMWNSWKLSAAMNAAFIKMASQQMIKLNGATVTVTDLLPSNELKRAFRAVEESPMITEMLLNTVLTLVSDPTKLTYWSNPANLANLCVNQTVFEALFTPPNAGADMKAVMEVVCGANINVTILVQELTQNLDGLTEIISLVASEKTGNSIYQLNVTELFLGAQSYANSLTSVIQNPPTVVLPNDDWLNGTVWTDLWLRFEENSGKLGMSNISSGNIASFLPFLEGMLSQLAVDPAARVVLSKVSDVLQITSFMFDDAQKSVSGDPFAVYRGTVEAAKILDVLNNAPDLMEILLNTMLSYEKANALIQLLAANASAVCMDPSRITPYVVYGENTRVNVTSLVHMFCTMDYDVLLKELSQPYSRSTAVFARLFAVPYNENYNSSMFVSNLQRAISSITGASQAFTRLFLASVNNTTPIAPRWMDEHVWKTTFGRVAERLQQQQVNLTQVDYAGIVMSAMRPLLSMLGPSEQQVFARIADSYLFTVELMKMIQATPSEVRSMFNDTVELKKLIGMLDNLPGYVEDLLYVASDPVKMNGFIISLISGENWCEAGMKQNSKAITYICTQVNFTVLEQEVMSHQGDLLAPLQRMVSPSHKYTFSVDGFLHSYMSLQKQTENLINYLVKVSQGAVNSTSILPWLDDQKWSAMFDRLTKHIVFQYIGTNQPDYTRMIITSMKPTLSTLAQLPGAQYALARISDGYLFATELMKLMQASPSEAHSMFNDTMELRKLIGMLDNLPIYVEDLLYMATDPVKMNGFIISLISGENWCEAGMKQNSRVITYLCTHINFTVLEQEVMSHQGDLLAPLQRMLTPGYNYTTFSVDSFLHSYMSLQKQTENLINYLVKVSQGGVNSTSILPWLDGQRWSAMFNRFTKHIISQNNGTTQPDYTRMIINSMKPTLTTLAQLPGAQYALARISDGYLFATELMKLMQATPAEAHSMFNDTMELKKLIGMLDNLPVYVEDLLYMATDPVKMNGFIISLISGENWCEAGMKQNSRVIRYLCTHINFTVLEQEVMNHQGDLLAPLQRMLTPGYNYTTFSVDSFLHSYMSLQKQTENLINYLVKVSQGGVNSTSILPWLDGQKWSAMFDRFTKHIISQNNGTTQPDYTRMIITSMKPTLTTLAQLPGAQYALARISDGYLFATELMKLMQATPGEAHSMFNDTMELKKLIGMLDNLPVYVEDLLYMATDPVKMNGFIISLISGENWCEAGMKQNSRVIRYLCTHINFTVLEQEVMSHQGDLLAPLQRMLTPGYNYTTFSVDSFLHSYMSLQKQTENLINYLVKVSQGGVNSTSILPWLDGQRWSAMFNRFTKHIISQNNGTTQPDYTRMIINSMKPTLTTLAQLPGAQYALARISDGYLFATELMKLMQATPAEAHSIFNDTMELKKLIGMLDNLPVYVEDLLYMATDPVKMNGFIISLISGENWCEAGMKQNSRVITYLCTHINFTVLEQEVMSHQGDLLAPLQRMLTPGFNYTTFSVDSFLHSYMSLQKQTENLINYLIKVSQGGINSTSILPWLDGQKWSAMFDRFTKHIISQNNGTTQPDYTRMIITSMKPTLTTLAQLPGVQPVLARISDGYLFAIELMKLMQATPSDVHSMFNDTVELRKLIGMLDNLPIYVEDLLYMATDPVKMNGFIISLISGENWCEAGMKQNSRVITYICTHINFTVLEQEVMSHQGDFLAPLQRMVTPGYNYTAFSVDSLLHSYMSLQKQTENLINYLVKVSQGGVNSTSILPWLDGQKWSAMFDRFTKHIISQNNGTNQPDYTQIIITSMKPTLTTLAQLPGVQPVLARISDGYLFATELMKLMQATPSEVHSMFNDTVELRKLVGMLDNLPSYIEDLLYMASDPVKLNGFIQSLLNGATWCEAGMRQNSSSISYICTHINFTVLEQEAMSHQGDLLAPLQRMLSPHHNYTFNIDSFLQTIMTLQKQTESLINYLVKVSQGGVNSTSIQLWLDRQKWSAMFDRFTQHIIMEYNKTSSAGLNKMIMEAVKNSITPLVNITEVNNVLFQMNGMVKFLNVAIDMVKDPRDPLKMFDYTVEFKKVIDLLDQSPEIVEALLYTLTDPLKLMKFIDAAATNQLCNSSTTEDYVTRVPGSSLDTNAVKQTLCTVNYTAIPLELMNDPTGLKLIEHIQGLWDPSVVKKVNLDMFLSDINTLITTVTHLSSGGITTVSFNMTTPRWLNETRWAAIFGQFWTQLQARINVTANGENLLVWLHVLENTWLKNQPGYQQFNGAMNTMSAILDVVLEKLSAINGSYAQLTDLVQSSPQMVKLLEMINKSPDIVQILMYSLSTEKFLPLYQRTNVTQLLVEMCVPTKLSPPYPVPHINIKDYLTLPPGSNINIDELLAQFCDVDFTVLVSEAMAEFDIQNIRTQINNPAPTNWTVITQQITQLSAIITGWVKNPPNFPLDHRWMNATIWLDILSRYAASQNNPQEIVMNLGKVLYMLEPLFANNTDVQRLLYVVDTLQQVVTQHLKMYPGQNLTLASLLSDTPQLLTYIRQSLALGADVQEVLLHAVIKRPAELSKLAAMPNPWYTLCEAVPAYDIATVFVLPDHVNASAVRDLICKTNMTAISMELMNKLGLASVIAKLSSGQEVRTDLRQVLTNSQELYGAISALITNPPTFVTSSLEINITAYEHVYKRFLEAVNFTNAEYYRDMIANLEITLRNIPGAWEAVKGQLLPAKIMVDYMTSLLSRIQPQEGVINLASLFRNPNRVVDIMNMAFNLGPDFVNAIMSTYLKPIKVVEFALLKPSEMQAVMCSEERMSYYIQFHSSFNVSYAVKALCGLNATKMVEQLSSEFNINSLLAQLTNLNQSFSLQSYLDSYNTYSGLLTQLFMATDVYFKDTDLAQLFNYTPPADQSNLLAFVQNLPQASVESLASMLQQLMPMVEQMDWWKEVRPHLDVLNILVDTINNKLDAIAPYKLNMTLESVLPNSHQLRRFIERNFGLAPELVQAVMYARIDSAKLGKVKSPTDLFCTDVLSYPWFTNETAIKEVLCNVNYMALWEEIKVQLNYEAIVNQLSRARTNATLPPFNWTTTLANMRDLTIDLGALFTNFTVPPLDKFFGYEGNFTAWIIKMETAYLQPSMTLEDLPKVLAGTLDSLSPLLESSITGRSLLAMYKQYSLMLDIVHRRLKDLQGSTISLDSLLVNATHVKSLLKATLGVSPSVVETLLLSQPRLDKLTVLLSAKDPFALLCNSSFSFVELPPNADMNVTQLYRALCSVNVTVIVNELMAQLDIHRFMEEMSRINSLIPQLNKSMSVDWSTAIQSVMDINKIIAEMVTKPPPIDPALIELFNFDKYLPALQKFIAHYQKTLQTNMDLNELAKIFDSLTPLLKSTSFGKDMLKSLQIANLILENVNYRIDKFSNSPVSLQTLLGNGTRLSHFLETSLKLAPEVISALLQANIKPSKMRELIQLPSNESVKALCGSPISDYFELPAGSTVSVDQFKLALCSIDVNVFVAELAKEYRQDVLDREIAELFKPNATVNFNMTALLSNLQGMISLSSPSTFANLTVSQQLIDLFNMTRFEPVIQALAKNDPMRLMDTLLLVAQMFEGTGQWNASGVNLMFNSLSVQIKLMNVQMKMLTDLGYNVENVLTNMTAVRELMDRLMQENYESMPKALRPTYEAMLMDIMRNRPAAVRRLFCNETALRSVLSLPLYVNASAMSMVLCTATPENVWNSFIKAGLNTGELVGMTTKLIYYTRYYPNTLSPVRWQELKQNLRSMVDVIDKLSKLPPNVISGFNATYWQPIMETLVDSVARNSFTGVLRTMQLLDPLLRDQQFWKEIQSYVQLGGVYMQWLADQLEKLEAAGGQLKLVNLMPDVDKVTTLLRSAIGPQAAAEFLTVVIQPNAVLRLIQTKEWPDVFCNRTAFASIFKFPTGVDVVSLQIQLCQSVKNGSLVVDQLMGLINVQRVVKEMERLTKKPSTNTMTQDPFKFFLKQAQRLMLSVELIQKLGNISLGGFEDYLRPITATLTVILDPSANNIGGMCDSVVSLIDETVAYPYIKMSMLTSQTTIEIMEDILKFIPDIDDLMCDLSSLDLIGILQRFLNKDVIDVVYKFEKLITQNFTSDDFKCSAYIGKQMALNDLFNFTIYSMPSIGVATEKCAMQLLTGDFKMLEDFSFYIKLMNELQNFISNDTMGVLSQLTELKPIMDMIISGITSQTAYIGDLRELFTNASDIQQILSKVADLTPRMVDSFLQSTIKLNAQQFFNQTVEEIAAALCSPRQLEESFNISPLLGLTSEQLSKRLCGPNVTQLAASMKSAVNVAQLAAVVSQSSNGTFNIQWLIGITDDLKDILKYTGSLIKLQSAMPAEGGINIEQLLKILPSIEDFINNKGPDALFESMYSLIGKLAAVATTPESKEFLQNLESLTRGIRGLNVFKNLFPTVAVKDLVKDPQSLHKYMVDKVKLSPRTAAAVLNATFKYTMFLGQNMSSINLTDLFCNKSSLSVLLNFDPSVDVGVVSRALCSLNTSMITAVTSELLPKMDIGNLIKEYFQKVAADGSLYSMMLMPDEVMTFDPNKLLGSSNVSMNVSQLKETVEQLKPVSTKLNSALQEVKNFTNSGNVPNVSTLIDPITGKFQAQVGLRTVSSMLCGSTNAFELPEVSMFGNSPGSSSSNNDPTSGSSVGSQSPGSQGAGSQSAAAAPTSASADGKTPSNAGTTPASDPRVKYASVMKFFPKDAQEDFFSLPSDFCRDLYMQMTDSDTASVIWHYLKPLLRGTILFSPDTPAVRRIIKMANSTFFEISRLQEFARTVLAGSDGLSQLMNQDFSKLENALKNSFVSTAIQQMTGVKSQDLLNSLTNFGGMSPDDFKNIQRLAELVVDFLDCVNMDVFQPVATSEEANKEAVKLAAKGKFIASVEFLNMDQRRSRRDAESSDGIPKHIQYKIRTSTDNSPPTERIKDLLWVPGPEDSFAFDLSYLRGFVQLQEMIDRAIIKVHARDNVTLPVTYLQQEPYPCYEKDSFVHWFRFVIPIMMTLAFIFVIANAVRLAVYDKQTGMDETLKIMGLNASTDWLAWFLNIFLGMVVMSIILVIILKVSGILRYSDPIILGLFFICFSFSTLMLCYLISVFFNRTNLAALTGIIVYLTMYLPYVFVTVLDQQLLFWENMIVCLFSTSAFSLGCAYVTRYEEQGIGIQFSNIDRSPMAGDDLTLSWCCIMMVIDAAIYGVIAWYIRHVFPGKLGMPQPWYFFLTPRYWGCCLGSSHKYKARRSSSNVENGADCVVEPLITGLPVGIGIDSMTKKYKKNKLPAIDNLNLDFFEGQVSALLGENGAGKTTTIKTLIGMFPPTKGTAYINDLDVRTDFLKIRRDLGYCPQQDTLFEDMTVQEHLMFFAQLKTDSAAYKVKHDVHRMLRKIDLNKVRNELVANLSGGQRRRLAVAIAFIGDSKVIILDEPTSGVDPAARRKIWDIITKHREDRTVVLCTHHLDEAELIGDRIAILNKGKLVCNGSPMFLRAKFGDGYQLTISKKQEVTSENSDAADCTSENAVTEFIASRMPGAHLISSLGSQLIYVLPREQQGIYHRFFQELDHHKDELNIGNYGVSDSSLESIYLKVCKESLRRGSENPGFRDFNQEETETHVPSEDVTVSVDTSLPQLNGQRTSGCGLKMQQLGALLAKRFHHHKRYWRGYISTILVPMLLMCLAMGSSLLTPRDKQQPSLQLQTSLYQPSHVYIKNADSSLESKQIKAAFTGPSGLGTTCMPGQNMTWLDWKLKKIEGQCKIVTNTGFKEPSLTQADEEKYAKNLQCSCDAVTGRQICPDGAEGRPMPSMKLNSTDFIYDLGGEDVEDWIVKSHQQFLEKRYGGWVLEKSPEEELMMTVYYNNKGHHAITAFLNAMSNSLLRSMINTSGVDSNEYGITTYNHPITFASGMLDMDTLYQRAADTGISVTILCAFCFIPAGFIIYLVAERVKKEKHLQHLAGVGPILYWVSAFIWDLFCCLWPVAISAAIMAGFGLSVYNDRLNLPATVLLLFLFCWATIPFCYLISRMFENTSTAYMMAFCINFFLGLNTTTTMFLLRFFTQKPMVALVYNHLQYILLVFPQYALGGGLIQLATNQLETEMFSRFNLDKYRDPFTMRMLLPNYIALCVSGVVFFVLTLLLEMHCQCRSQVHSDNKYAEDEDVTMERKRVAHSRPGEDTLTISELTKVYRSGLRKVLAVDNITFGVSKGECFGLLGVNGAGKTTTFKMLTSDISASGGNAQLMGKNILSAPSNMGSVVGYCPQVDALDDFLTGKEVLTIYAKMKGITGKDVDVIVSNALSMMELSHCANKMTKNYSGGMKRKLSAAMALIGDPLIVFMDEPTSGMDPVSRRLLWKHVQNVIKDGRSVILTSHSMSECDALCTRLAIMVNGQFKCLGNPQHIKSKYGEGYTVQVRAAAHAMDDVKTFVLNTFPGALIKEQQYNIMEFHTSYSTTSLSAIFGHLESHKKPLQILDYSVAQTTLDQVFVNFANHQSDGTMGGNSAPSSCESTPKAEHQSKSNQSQYASNLTYGTLEHDLPLNVRNGKDTKVAEETEDTYF